MCSWGKEIEICKTSNQISTDTYFLAKYLFFKNSKFQFGTFIKNQTHLYLFCNDIRFLYFFYDDEINLPTYLQSWPKYMRQTLALV